MGAVDLDVLWAMTREEPLLLGVEDFLTNVGEAGLSLSLNKLQQDVALEIASHFQDPLMGQENVSHENLDGLERFLEDAEPDNLHETPLLQKAYEPITPERFAIFAQVEAALSAQGAETESAFKRFHQSIRQQLNPPAGSSPDAAPKLSL